MPALDRQTVRLRVCGVVQGVGYRPFVWRLARRLGLAGWVGNDGGGVCIHAEGPGEGLDHFRQLLVAEAPAAARVEAIATETAPAEGCVGFRITVSRGTTADAARVPPDRAACAACLREVNSPEDRRRNYAFATCTECGPRYSLVRQMPYDRVHTGMVAFPLCSNCEREYNDPRDRRFHAEATACPGCGPRLTFRGRGTSGSSDTALQAAAECLRAGQILALKGLGGFQLLVRADDSAALTRLRTRKGRPTKPFAVMVSSPEAAARLACISASEWRLLTAPENPIVLLERRADADHLLAPEVAPGLRHIGLFLPTTPLHDLLLRMLDFAVVATSGNRSEEPIACDDAEAAVLSAIADAFLTHNRPVVRRVDDSVARVIESAPVVLRLGRGYAPLPLPALESLAQERGIAEPVLATGGHQKTAIALWTGRQAVLGPHLGDLDGPAARDAFVHFVQTFTALYGCRPRALACDLHPDYFTTRWASEQGLRVTAVQHHHAHAAACLTEHGLLGREVLAFTWDGTGYGSDGTVWGGEVLRARANSFVRVASLRPFALPGNEAAVRQPWRVALCLLADTFGVAEICEDGFALNRLGLTPNSARILLRMAARGVNTPRTSSMGRLFDAAAALILNVREVSSEGEAAAWLESVARVDVTESYSLPLTSGDAGGIVHGDWRPLFAALMADVRAGVSAGVTAARFHNALAGWAVAVAACQPSADVVLGGGCFQNALLTRCARNALERLGRRVHSPAKVPPGDGGLAAGQLAVALVSIGTAVGNT